MPNWTHTTLVMVLLLIKCTELQYSPPNNSTSDTPVKEASKPTMSPGEGDYGGYGWGDYQFSEYTLDEVHRGPPNIECYTCHYSKWKGYEQGMANCDDPFNAQGIPIVVCEGLCAKTRTKIGSKEYMIFRSCLPNCKDISDNTSSVECCFGTKCNGAHVAGLLIAANVTICCTIFMLGVFFMCML